MIDLRTLLLLMAVADLMLAAALWVGSGRGEREGLSYWGSSLVVRALAFSLFAGIAPLPSGALAVGVALVALSITLQGASLLAFDRRGFAAWIHTAVIAAVAVPLQLVEREPTMAVLFGGVVLGTLLMAVSAIAWNLRALPSSRARVILAASFLIAGAAFMLRGLGVMLSAESVATFQSPSGAAAFAWLAVFAAALAATLGYLLLHKGSADAEAERLATIDPLTGAYNRRTFHEIAERELARARRAGQPLSMVLIDLDHFRDVNEKHGHVVGDEVLARFADLVRDSLRKEDMLVRFGGDQFLILLPEVPGPGAVVVAGRVRRRVADETLMAAGRRFTLTVSLGVAARLDEGPESVEGLLARATSALELAKERGRDRVVALSLGRSIAA